MRKHRKYCLSCIHNKTCNKPIICPIGNFDEFDNKGVNNKNE